MAEVTINEGDSIESVGQDLMGDEYISDEELESQIPDVEPGDEEDINETFLDDLYSAIHFDENYEDDVEVLEDEPHKE